MQYKMTSDGAQVSGVIRMNSKNELLEVSGDYNAVFKVEGTLDQKLEKDIFDRYLVKVGQEIASGWQKYETKAIANFKKKMDAVEKALEKKASKVSQSELKSEVDRQNSNFKQLAETEFVSQMNEFVGKAHAAALKNMDKAAKSVLKDKKKLILKGVKIVVGLAVVIGTTVAAPPAGAALIIAAVATCLGAAAKAGADGIKLSNEFIGNYKSYNKSLGELDTQINETIKYARACEAKRDRIMVQKAQIEMHMDRIKKEDPAASLKDNPDLKASQKQLDDLIKSLDRMADYSANDVETELTKARAIIKELRGAPYQERGAAAVEKLGTFAKVAALASKGLTKIAKKAA